MAGINVKCTYPNSDEYEYETMLVQINFEEEYRHDMQTGEGFDITQYQEATKKDIKEQSGMFSGKYGGQFDDLNPYGDVYKCTCGETTGAIRKNSRCPNCGGIVKYVGDDIKKTGWVSLQNGLYIISPPMFKILQSYIGKDFMGIIEPIENKDENGFTIPLDNPPDNPYRGYGIMKFKQNFKEIIDFYYKSSKKDKYGLIMDNINNAFTCRIPFFTTILRPYRIENNKFIFEDTNKIFKIMNSLSFSLNNKKFRGKRVRKNRNKMLLNLNLKFIELYDSVIDIIVGKKGTFRSVYSGRCTYSSRSVIRGNRNLRIDQVVLSYYSAVELLQQHIINILKKTYNKGYDEAYEIWKRSKNVVDERIVKIIKALIANSEHGIPILINRN